MYFLKKLRKPDMNLLFWQNMTILLEGENDLKMFQVLGSEIPNPLPNT